MSENKDVLNPWKEIFVHSTPSTIDGFNTMHACRLCKIVYSTEKEANHCCYNKKQMLLNVDIEEVRSFLNAIDKMGDILFNIDLVCEKDQMRLCEIKTQWLRTIIDNFVHMVAASFHASQHK